MRYIAYRYDEYAPEVLVDDNMLSYVLLLSEGAHPDNNGGEDYYIPLDPIVYDRLFPGQLNCWVK